MERTRAAKQATRRGKSILLSRDSNGVRLDGGMIEAGPWRSCNCNELMLAMSRVGSVKEKADLMVLHSWRTLSKYVTSSLVCLFLSSTSQ
jgi:hypothetical protein